MNAIRNVPGVIALMTRSTGTNMPLALIATWHAWSGMISSTGPACLSV